MNRRDIESGYRAIQASLAAALEGIDGSTVFRRDAWRRPDGGGGESCTLGGDGPIERAAVNFSAVWGPAPPTLAERIDVEGEFYATGISTIVHPRDPHAPTFHANLRYFETNDRQWFGGGADLTPYYLFDDDARHFHRVLRQVAEKHPVADYPAWKAECDRYFYLPHRQEARGVGGLFFDHLTQNVEEVWAFQIDLGAALSEAYCPILEHRIGTPHTEREIRWHELRRGRYVEFNLVWDRGTRFGLDTGGRTESILASLPPRARWDESFRPEPGSPEAELLELVRGEPRAW
ncbi:MAG TPA: oxygen-dependent coproporphyrinogen oxidase [Acidimicrobiia bacterium]|nr:oxygen-dependent coproporphyrinogen oxidase [Acidimicrobiia bacterium]